MKIPQLAERKKRRHVRAILHAALHMGSPRLGRAYRARVTALSQHVGGVLTVPQTCCAPVLSAMGRCGRRSMLTAGRLMRVLFNLERKR